ncbi:MAG TPA: hypothetical protein VKP66_11815 [Steroidobacteraceae bacterium]|nr:hypothetical protein [Steroidobacteraceae bacterium]
MSLLHIRNAWQRTATRTALSLVIAAGGVGAVAAPAEPAGSMRFKQKANI